MTRALAISPEQGVGGESIRSAAVLSWLQESCSPSWFIHRSDMVMIRRQKCYSSICGKLMSRIPPSALSTHLDAFV